MCRERPGWEQSTVSGEEAVKSEFRNIEILWTACIAAYLYVCFALPELGFCSVELSRLWITLIAKRIKSKNWRKSWRISMRKVPVYSYTGPLTPTKRYFLFIITQVKVNCTNILFFRLLMISACTLRIIWNVLPSHAKTGEIWGLICDMVLDHI